MLTTTASSPRRAVESALLSVLAEIRRQAPRNPSLRAPRPLMPAVLADAWQRTRTARDLAADVLGHEALAIAGMALMFLAFLMV